MKTTNAFRVEEFRSKLATQKKYKKLRGTYSAIFPEINDLNTPALWDHLNFKFFDIKTQNPMMWDRLNTVAKMIPFDANKILDIGFGGAHLENLISKTYDWHCVDISPKSVKSASSKYPDMHFQLGSITNINFPKAYFDCAISLEVLEHIPPHLTFKALSEIYRILKPRGFLLLSVPLNEDLEQMIKNGINPNAHVRVYTPALIQAELEIIGFKIFTRKFLHAFHKNYIVKKMIVRLFPHLKQPNIIILLAQKL